MKILCKILGHKLAFNFLEFGSGLYCGRCHYQHEIKKTPMPKVKPPKPVGPSNISLPARPRKIRREANI